MELFALTFKASAFIWVGLIYVGYICKAANSEPLANQKQGKPLWIMDLITITATIFIAYTEVVVASANAFHSLVNYLGV